jgi:hypothetical protein
MHCKDEQNRPKWGARINKRALNRTQDYPDWANSRQREKWDEQGLVLWDYESQQITRLWAGQALQLLEHLRTNHDWKQTGVVVGEPATQIFLDDPERKPEQVLNCQFELSPDRAQALFDLLQEGEAILKETSELEEKECRRALNNCYKTLFGEKIWAQLCRFYEMQPEETLKVAQELLALRLDRA